MLLETYFSFYWAFLIHIDWPMDEDEDGDGDGDEEKDGFGCLHRPDVRIKSFELGAADSRDQKLEKCDLLQPSRTHTHTHTPPSLTSSCPTRMQEYTKPSFSPQI